MRDYGKHVPKNKISIWQWIEWFCDRHHCWGVFIAGVWVLSAVVVFGSIAYFVLRGVK